MPIQAIGSISSTSGGTVVAKPGSIPNNADTLAILQLSGTFTTITGGQWQGSVDGTNFQNIAAVRLDTGTIEYTPTVTNSTLRQWKADITGFQSVQFVCTGLATGTLFVAIQTSTGSISSYLTQTAGSSLTLAGAITAGGLATNFVQIGTSGPALYSGSGAPTITAAQGSLYLRTDGSSTSTRLYVNSTGSTTWVAITSAS